MNTEWIKTRQTKYSAYLAVYVLVVLLVLGAINFLANRYDKTYDSTANKQFTLSDQTIKVADGLKHDIHLTFFGDSGTFGQPGGPKDLLDRYAGLSPKIRVEYIDPVRKPQQAKAAGYRSDAVVMVDNGPRREAAKSLTEEEVTGALIRSLKSGERNVCFVNAAGERSIDNESGDGYSLLKQLLERDNYKARSETLKPAAAPNSKPMAIGQTAPAGNVEVPKDCSVLVVGGPQLAYPKPIVDAIKAYVEGGGRALIMLDETLRLGRAEPAADNPDLLALLAGWGVTVDKNLVLDLSGMGQLLGLGPEVPFILQYESHAITQPLTRVPTAFPVVRALDVKNGDKTSVSKLVATTDDSIAVDNVPPGGAIDPKQGKKGPFTLAAAGTLSGATPGRFVVVGTSLWAANNFAGSRSLGNRDLFLNTINWLSSDEDLISIRPKAPDDRPLNITQQRLAALFWLSIVIFPLGIVMFGLATWWKRR
jgi:ABC-type uncharacterized transport system involved in gliding motility auxiliary subunit